jgi:tRNA (guanine26-N2/guanine27-N2)-dimethyltransferase
MTTSTSNNDDKKAPTDDKKSTDNNNDNNSNNFTSITEGTATMRFPADQESTVFYNPVQVQNRDLSVLMIALYAERRAVRRAVKEKRKELNQQQVKGDALQQQLNDYEATLDGQKLLVQDESKDDGGISILDALAASGLRSIRYWKEIPGVRHVTINDLEEAAIKRAKDNLQHNHLEDVLLEDNQKRLKGICVHHGDATHELYMSRRPQSLRTFTLNKLQEQQQPMWDVIDLDPYGSAAPFLDGAVQAVENGGLLCITCTDMAALGGSHPETAYGRYASLPIQSAKYLQELALRILLHTIAVSAARYGRTIRPVLSVGMAFYVRVFVEIHNDKKGVSDLSLNIGQVYQSTKCSTFATMAHGVMGGKKGNVYQSMRLAPSNCPETGAAFKVGGPIWLGALHDKTVIGTALERLSHSEGSSPKMEFLATRARLEGLLTSVSEEIEAPLYYTLPDLCRTLHCSSPPLKRVMAGIYNAGYQVSGFHKESDAIKTNAPSHVVWDVLKAWIQQNPMTKAPPEDSAAAQILAKKASIDVDFTIPKSFTTRPNVSRFPLNPEKHWGPKRKASGTGTVPPATKRKAKDDGEEKEDHQPTKRAAITETDKE